MTLDFKFIKNNLDDPTFSESQGYFYDTRAPNSGDDAYINTIPFGNNFLVYWWDQSNNDTFILTNWGSTPLIWEHIVSDSNILFVIQGAGWQINTTRNYSDQSSLGFNTSRQPSTTNDVYLSCSVTLTNTLLTTSTVALQISLDNSTFTTISTLANLSEAVNSSTYSASIVVPAGYYYKLTTSGSGTQTLVNLQELIS
jgi:hypothetical protein